MPCEREQKKPTPERLLADYPDNLIINRPDLKTLLLLIGEQILTVLFWGFWIYLWLPLISLIAWLLGFSVFYFHMVKLGGFQGLLQQLNVFTSGVGLLSGSLVLWSFYNMKRYGRHNRRVHILSTDLEALSRTYDMNRSDLERIQRAKKICFAFREDGSLVQMQTNGQCRSPEPQETAGS